MNEAALKNIDVQPMGNRVIVAQDKAPDEKRAKGGLIIAHGDKTKAPNYGTVIAIGPDQHKIEVGYRVIFAQYASTEIEVDDEKYQLLDEGGILAIFIKPSQK